MSLSYILFVCKIICVCVNVYIQLLAAVGAIAGGTGALLFTLEQSVKASGTEVHPQSMPWSHKGLIASLDHAR